MAQISSYIDIPIVDGVNYVFNPLVNIGYATISGNTVLTSNWSIASAVGVVDGDYMEFLYKATPTLGGNHIFIFGEQMPDNLTSQQVKIEALYDGTAWRVIFIPDFEESSIVATDDIMDDAVTNDKLANINRGFVKVGGAANAPTDLDAKTSGQILVGDGTDLKSVPVSGDGTLSAAGALTIAADAITNTKLANITRGSIKVGGVADAPTDLNAKTAGYILIGDGTDLKSVPMTGDGSISPAGVLTVTGLSQWEGGAGTGAIQSKNSVSGCSSVGDYSFSMGLNCTASDDETVAIGNGCNAIAARAVAIGNNCEGNATDTTAFGKDSVANIPASIAHSSGKFNRDGDNQIINTILKITTTDATPTFLQLEDLSEGVPIPTDCSSNVHIRIIGVQIGGTVGTVGQTFMQDVELCVANIAGVSTVQTAYAATTVGVHTKTANVIYKDGYGALSAIMSAAVSVAANKIQVEVTSNVDRIVRWSALVSNFWIGHTNFLI